MVITETLVQPLRKSPQKQNSTTFCEGVLGVSYCATFLLVKKKRKTRRPSNCVTQPLVISSFVRLTKCNQSFISITLIYFSDIQPSNAGQFGVLFSLLSLRYFSLQNIPFFIKCQLDCVIKKALLIFCILELHQACAHIPFSFRSEPFWLQFGLKYSHGLCNGNTGAQAGDQSLGIAP